MKWNAEIDCPICKKHGSITTWERKESGQNLINYFFKCNKCKREWH